MVFRILVLTLLSFRLVAQQFSPAPFLGMGKAALAQDGVFALSENPAGIANIQNATVSMAYQRHFMASDIASQCLLAAFPVFSGTAFGISLTNHGIFDVTTFLRTGATYARAFGPNILTSITANYHQHSVREYGSSTAFSADLGLQILWSEKVATGFFFRNISASRFPNTLDQRVPQEVGAGFRCRLSEEVQVAADLLKEFPHRLVYRGGFSYFPDRRFAVRAGALSNPLQYTAGTAFRMEKWQFDLASVFHARLGSSPQMSVSYAF